MEFQFANMKDRPADEDQWLAKALERCNFFQIEVESGYPILPVEAFLGAAPEVALQDSLKGLSTRDKSNGGLDISNADFSEAYSDNLIEEYIRLIEPVTDAPRAFHLATLLSVVGSAAGRRSFFIGAGGRQYLNTWILLAGPSASGKSTAAGYGLKLFDGISKHLSDRNLAINRNIGSIQAMMLSMKGLRPGSTSRPILNYEDEVLDLIAKSKKDATLLVQLLASYGCPEKLENNTLKSQITVKEPCLSMLACGVDKTLPNKFSREDTESGFLNRWCVFLSWKTRKLAIGPMLDEKRLFLITKILAQRLHEAEGEVTLSDGSRKLYTDWYGAVDDQTNSLLARTTSLARKHACIYAILDGML